MKIEEHEQQIILGALDSLGVALADHDHEWAVGERTIYEEAIKLLTVSSPSRKAADYTIMRLGVRVGSTCKQILDEKMRGLNCSQIEVDELWGFIGKKQVRTSQTDRRIGLGDRHFSTKERGKYDQLLASCRDVVSTPAPVQGQFAPC